MNEKYTPRIWSGDPIEVESWVWSRTLWIPERTLSPGDIFVISGGQKPGVNPEWISDIEICNRLGDGHHRLVLYAAMVAVIIAILIGVI